MPDKKHHVFSARTTEDGLGILSNLRKERNVDWDDLVIDAVCAHYGLSNIPNKNRSFFAPSFYA
ncbi:hypothetical protein ACFLYR_05745 [Chloroflexota bacterium]